MSNLIIPDVTTIVLLLAAGAFAGLTGGLFGIGGGIVTVPVLFWYFSALFPDNSQLIHFAVATSLAMIILTATSSFLAHKKHGSIDMATIRRWGWLIGLGACVGGATAPFLKQNALTLLFAAFSVLIAVELMRLKTPQDAPSTLQKKGLAHKIAHLPGIGFVIGFISALFGVGGGSMNVPALIYRGLPTPTAIGTSSLFGLIIAITAIAGFFTSQPLQDNALAYTFGFVYLPALIIMAPIAMLIAPTGAKWANCFNPTLVRRLFGALILISAARMFYGILQT